MRLYRPASANLQYVKYIYVYNYIREIYIYIYIIIYQSQIHNFTCMDISTAIELYSVVAFLSHNDLIVLQNSSYVVSCFYDCTSSKAVPQNAVYLENLFLFVLICTNCIYMYFLTTSLSNVVLGVLRTDSLPSFMRFFVNQISIGFLFYPWSELNTLSFSFAYH